MDPEGSYIGCYRPPLSHSRRNQGRMNPVETSVNDKTTYIVSDPRNSCPLNLTDIARLDIFGRTCVESSVTWAKSTVGSQKLQQTGNKERQMNYNRRDALKLGMSTFMSSALASRLSTHGGTSLLAAESQALLPIAAVVTEYRKDSHADVIVGKVLEGYEQAGGAGPGLKIVSIFTDQVPENDMSRPLAEKYGVRVAKTIDEAISLGTNEVQVAGVLSIGEHGQYPYTPDTKQHMYPRRRLFDDIVATFRRCGKSVPVFNDKHLAYRWEDAKYMVDTAKEMNFPFLAGSSLPVAWREPVLELPIGCEIEAALALGYSSLEAYGYHALETLQCMIERRKGGETGVTSVQAVQGDAIRQAETQGRWSRELFEAALAVLPGSIKDDGKWMQNAEAAAFLMQHRDGLKSAVMMTTGLSSEFAFAVKIKGQAKPIATWFKLQPKRPYGHFSYLVQAFEQTIRTGKAAYPVERTLLTTGVLDRVMHSLAQNGKELESPELAISYQAAEWPFANHPKSTLILPNN